MAIVASGDPLFYGVARYLCDRLGKERFEVLPHVSSMQLAFARVKETLGGSLPHQPGHASAGRRARPHPHRRDGRPVHQRAGRTRRRSPGKLLARGLDYFRAYVCENLGGPDERVTQGELRDIAGHGVRAAQRDDPQAQAGPAGSAGDGRRDFAASAIPTTSSRRAGPRAA